MANKKISEYTELTTPVGDDLLAIVDVSESSDSDKNKKIKYGLFTTTSVEVPLTGDTTDLETTDIAYFRIPEKCDGMNLVRATAHVITAGTTGATTFQVRNMTKYASNDALSTAISIASGDALATAGTVNTSYDDVSTNDLIKVTVTGVSTTKPKGGRVILEFRKP